MRIVPIRAPLVNVVAHIEKTVWVRRIETHGFRTVPLSLGVLWQLLGPGISPAIEPPLDACTRGPLPLRFRGQSIIPRGDLAKPFAKSDGIKPRWPNHRLLRLLEIGVIPEGG